MRSHAKAAMQGSTKRRAKGLVIAVLALGLAIAIAAQAFAVVAPESNCPNQAFRTGPSAALPDCRAYEMVSPVDKNGGDISFTFGPNQSSPDGNRFTYATKPAFGDQPSSKALNQYLATRHEGEGWTNHGINAPRGRLAENEGGGATPVTREVTAFSRDLCDEWMFDQNFFPLAPGAQQGYVNLYRHDLCGGGFEALTTTTPPAGARVEEYVGRNSVQGFSADGSEAFFVARSALTPEAAPGGDTNFQIYAHSPSGLHLVSVLPGGVPDPGFTTAGAEVGSGSGGSFGGYLDNAVSEDGSRVFWTSADSPKGEGKIYLREHPEQGIVAGECSEPSKACTIPVSAGEHAFFWTAAADGSAALYSEGELGNGEENQGNATLYRFDVDGETSTPLAQGVSGVLGASDDLSRVYFLSQEALTPGQQNSAGDEAVAGQPNLYLDEGGTKTYIATLLAGKSGDLKGAIPDGGNVYGIGYIDPLHNASRVSPDGAHIAFQSRAPLTGYDNTDAENGKADIEVFTYEAGGGLKCASCNPSGARPNGGEAPLAEALVGGGEVVKVWAAARIPGWEVTRQRASNVLSADGSRLFFMAHDALVPADTNGAQDIYEWEAPGAGGCTAASPAYHQVNGGCVYLISSGESPEESYFWEASPDGSDVFFGTASGLLPQDPGLVDIYDARAGGGFPQPTPPPACEGESCQSAPPPPTEPTLSSASFRGEGNPKARKPSQRCAKGRKAVKKRGKTRCVPKHHRTANHNRRTAR